MIRVEMVITVCVMSRTRELGTDKNVFELVVDQDMKSWKGVLGRLKM